MITSIDSGPQSAEMNRLSRRENLYHEARLLLLIDAFTEPEQEFLGLTKLVKLDFLLRYPLMTHQLLPDGVDWPQGAEPSEAEKNAVESRMIRYKYGPWDDRYYPLLGALAGKQLLSFTRRDRFAAVMTHRGREAANTIAISSAWSIVAARAKFLQLHFDRSGFELKDLIYAKLPSVVDRPIGSEI